MEILINNVDTHVDNVLGKSFKVIIDKKKRTLCNYVYSIKRKYELIFEIARHLSDDFKIIRETIMRKCTDMNDSLEKVIDISEFQEELKIIFETKGVITQFTNENVPAPKKSMAVHEAKVKTDKKDNKSENTKEQLDKLNEIYRKEKLSFKDDTDIMNKIIATGLKLAEDPANKDVKVFLHKDIVELLKKEKKRACWGCYRCNCFLKQTTSQKLKMTKQYFGECKGKEPCKKIAP